METFICQNCGCEFESRTKKKFCTLKCYHTSTQFKMMHTQNLENLNKDKIQAERTCVNCGKPFHIKPSRTDICCSKNCQREWHSKRYDRWIANPEKIALPQAFDEFLSKERLTCLVEGCTWEGKSLSAHMNIAHGVTAAQFKKMVGFNKKQGVVCPELHNLRSEITLSYINEPSLQAHFKEITTKVDRTGKRGKMSLQGREKMVKSRLDRQQNLTLKVCPVCGCEFETRNRTCCSPKCTAALRNKTHGQKITAICAHCQKEFHPAGKHQIRKISNSEPVFCSPSCNVTYQRLHHPDLFKREKKPEALKTYKYTGICPVCGKTWKSHYPRVYCNSKCRAKDPTLIQNITHHP